MTHPQIVWEYCGRCGGPRQCAHLFTHNSPFNTAILSGEDNFTLYRCQGCGYVFMVHRQRSSQHLDSEGNQIINSYYYPPLVVRSLPKSLTFQPGNVLNFDLSMAPLLLLANETCSAVNVGLSALAAMGSRAMLDWMLVKLVGDIGGFEKKLAAMVDQGHITENQKQVLVNTLELGHSAMHRGHRPDMKDVQLALDIIDNMIELLFCNHLKASALQGKIPKRLP